MGEVVTGFNYIGGQWVYASSEETFEDRSPADTRQLLGTCPRSNAKDAAAAVQAAREAFPAWSRMSKIKRAEFLDTFTQLVKQHQEELARLMAQECGKAINESRADVVEGLHTAQYWFGRARMNYGEVLASEIAEKESYVLRRPKGVVVCISPWNFPFAIPLWLVCPSLVEGNTVVLKPAEETPLMAQRIVELLELAGLPPGVLNLVQGYGEDVGWPLVTHPDVDAILFTGSYQVGSMIKQEAARDYKKFAVAEMGGKNAIIVFDDADLDLAVNAALLSAFKTTGQRCTAASRLIVQEGIFDRFAQALVEKARRIRVGDPLAEDTFMGPLVSEAGLTKVLSYNQLAKEEGAEVLLDGNRLDGRDFRHGYYVSPFIYAMPHDSSKRVLREEVFGPHLALIPFKSLEEAVYIHNDCEYGFAFSVCSQDYRKIRTVREECHFGVGYANLPTIGAEVHLPFGGLKKSGSGMPSAAGLLDAVSHRYAWTVNHDTEIKMAQGLRAEVPG